MTIDLAPKTTIYEATFEDTALPGQGLPIQADPGRVGAENVLIYKDDSNYNRSWAESQDQVRGDVSKRSGSVTSNHEMTLSGEGTETISTNLSAPPSPSVSEGRFGTDLYGTAASRDLFTGRGLSAFSPLSSPLYTTTLYQLNLGHQALRTANSSYLFGLQSVSRAMFYWNENREPGYHLRSNFRCITQVGTDGFRSISGPSGEKFRATLSLKSVNIIDNIFIMN